MIKILQTEGKPIFLNDDTLQTISITENKIVITFINGNQSSQFEKEKIQNWDKLTNYLNNKCSQYPWIRSMTSDATFGINGAWIDMFSEDESGNPYVSFIGGGELNWDDKESSIANPLIKIHLNDRLNCYFSNYMPIIIL